MAGESLIIGDGNWGVKSDSLLGYAMNSGRFLPRELTFTRATTGTRTNGALLVETTPYNLVQYSEQFNISPWSLINGATIAANTTTAPDGTLTADTLTFNGTAFGQIQQASTRTTGDVLTFSLWIKSSSLTSIALYIGNDTSSVAITSSWQRISITKTITSNSATPKIVSSVAGSVDIWGAQLVEGSSALDYLPTTTRLNIPRIDYSTGTAALLLEPQRTNLSLFSEQFDNAVWTRTTSTVTPNQGIAPNGTMTMDLLTFISGGTFTTQGISVTSGATYTFSVWLASQSGTQTVEIGNINLNSWQAVTITTTPQRFEVTQVASASTRFPGIKATAAYSIFAWGAQLELGAYPTSYIPTTSASVTRNADVMTRSNIFTEGLITAAGGTWFVELRNNVPLIRDANTAGLNLDTILGTNGLSLRNNSAGTRLTVSKYIASARTDLYVTTTNTCKIAIKWNGTTADIFENGVKVVSATPFTTTAMQLINGTSADVSKTINQMALFPTPLSDAECINITTL